MIQKDCYTETFLKNIQKCIVFAEKETSEKLPGKIKCLLGTPDLFESAKKDGFVKYLGGRKLTPENLKGVSEYEAAKFTFVDGKVPVWVNLHFEGFDQTYSYIRVLTARQLTDDVSLLYDMPDGTKQFRILYTENPEN